MIFVYMLPAVLFSAGAIVAMKLALKDFLPLDIVFLRFIIATITMLLWAFFNKVKLFNIEKKDLIKVGCCGFLLWLYNMLLVISLKHTAAIRVGALSALIPITTLLYLGLCGSAISYLLIQKSVQTYGPSNTNIFMNLVPGVSIVMSVYILGEHISLYSCVCILVIIGAVIVKNISFNSLTNILKGK